MLQLINDFLWTKIPIFVLIGLGLTFTIASRFVQFPYLGRMFGVLRQAFRGAPELVLGIDAKRRRKWARFGPKDVPWLVRIMYIMLNQTLIQEK